MSQSAKLSQMTAILLERARKHGVQDDAILESIETNDLAVFEKALATHYSYEDFFTYATEHGEDLRSAIQNGYKMKYNTQGGLRTWLENRFGLLHEMDYNFEIGRLTKLSLSMTDAKYLYNVLAVNWVMLVSIDGGENELATEFFTNEVVVDNKKVSVDLIFLSEYQRDGGTGTLSHQTKK